MSDLLLGLNQNLLGIAAGMLVAAVCGYLGVYVVLKRIVFVGVSLAQISSAGIALAFLLGQSIPWAGHNPVVVSLMITAVGVLLYSQQSLSRRVPQESLIGLGYLIASALTLMFIVRSPKGMDDVKELLDGNIITVQGSDVVLMAVAFALVMALHVLFYKQFLFTSFDPEMAATQGYRVRAWELLFYGILGVAISVGIQFAGLLAVFAYLVIPAITGLMVARRMRTAFVIAVGSALLSTFLGFCWALKADLPTSPPIIAISALLLGLASVANRLLSAQSL